MAFEQKSRDKPSSRTTFQEIVRRFFGVQALVFGVSWFFPDEAYLENLGKYNFSRQLDGWF